MSDLLDPHSHASITAKLRRSGSVFAEDEANLLLSAGKSLQELALMVEKRISGVPIQVILGWAEFHGLRVGLVPNVFIPRPRSEFLVEQALTVCGAGSIVVDLCCGTGAIGMALITTLPQIDLYLSDCDATAVECAKRNLHSLGGHVSQGDLFEAIPVELKGRIEVIVANAPYVPTDSLDLMPREAREHEPRQTLDGGLDGLDVHRRIANEANIWLAPGGHLLVETSEDQAHIMARIFTINGLESKIVKSDEYLATVVIGGKQ